MGLRSIPVDRRDKRPTQRALVPQADQLAKLSLAQTKVLLETIDEINRREEDNTTKRIYVAAACLLICISSFTYLVMQNHEVAAGAVIGTTIVGVIGQIVNRRV